MPFQTRLTWRGDKALAQTQDAARRGVAKALERLRGLAVAAAPFREGDLRESAAVVQNENGGIGGAVTFDTPYAARQHEELDWKHKEGRARYLAGPLEENAPELGAIIATEIRRALR